jgi:pyridoxine 5-phosphate synthase
MQSCDIDTHQVNIVLTTDEEIRDLNFRFRKIDATTNVLSFPFEEPDDSAVHLLSQKELGDIVISFDRAVQESQTYNQPLQQRLNWLIVHGLLHLIGYDHERSEKDAEIMLNKEHDLLNEYKNQRRVLMPHLAVNVDHVATIREARGINEPDPVTAAAICELAGAQGIVVHLREDRRHIQDRDVRILRETVKTKLNLEMGAAQEIIEFALDLKPDMVTLVPEKRKELTTEGGLNVAGQKKKLTGVIARMKDAGIPVSLFIDPDSRQIEASYNVGATYVEIHTGRYSDAVNEEETEQEYKLVAVAAEEAYEAGLRVNAGHGLNYVNTTRVALLETIEELSIGHAIMARAIIVGLDQAVREMLALMM